ncbi:hypothetical protein F9C07_2544 [Aspergillus flavus]|uniref:Uncharacterized protein n=1 Tax=Aspergillus flavus (strain ATCC 200026 / FGSC A1120 / IAM 13836 / NRRL 3357 / JCM 12722 / SRRC 167) TaxID=332952 RepID=A0A7U2MF22_ASPFN|nr:hypothetical protein F9C07_2544 [Aspergillus flavus]
MHKWKIVGHLAAELFDIAYAPMRSTNNHGPFTSIYQNSKSNSNKKTEHPRDFYSLHHLTTLPTTQGVMIDNR